MPFVRIQVKARFGRLARKVLLPAVLILLSTPVGLAMASAAQRPAPQWERLPELSSILGFEGAFVGVSGDSLLVAGGSRPAGDQSESSVYSDRIFTLEDPAVGWSETELRLTQPVAHGVSLTWKDSLICLGGLNQSGAQTNAFLLALTSAEIQLRELPSLPQPDSHFSAALLGDTLYVAFAASIKARLWSLDLSHSPNTRSWVELESLPGPPRTGAVAASQDGSLFLFGGWGTRDLKRDRWQHRRLQDAYRYTSGLGWKRLADLPHPVAATSVPAIALGQSHLLVTAARGAAEIPDVMAYHTITDTWTDWSGKPVSQADGPFFEQKRGLTTQLAYWRGRVIAARVEESADLPTLGIIWAEPPTRTAGLHPLDYAALAAYLAVLIGMGFYFSGREHGTDDFFLAGRRIPSWACGLSLFGTSISAISFMAIPALVYRTNWLYFFGNMMIIAIPFFIIRFYLPFFRQLGVSSAYEYLEKRFGVAARLLGSGAFIVLQFARMGIVLYLPALALAAVTGFNIYGCILIMGIVATAYTVLGGIEAVIWTDVLQVVITFGGALLSFFIITSGIPGGIGQIVSMGMAEGKFHAVNLTWDATTTAIWVVVVGNFFKFVIPYSSDQTCIQRYLTTPDQKQAARAIWINAAMSVPGWTLFFAVGTALWAFYRVHPELLNPTAQTDEIFPWFIAQQLPMGVAGLAIAALLAASMSSLDSSMNSMAMALTTDFYRRFRGPRSERHFLNWARAVTVGLGIAGTGLALYLAAHPSGSMWDQFQKITGLFGSGLAGLFAAGIFTRRISSRAIVLGFVVSAILLYVVSSRQTVHFFLYGGIGIVSCFVTGWLASWLLPDRERDLTGLTLHTLIGEDTKSED